MTSQQITDTYTQIFNELLIAGLFATGWREVLGAKYYARHREFVKGTQKQRAWVTVGATLRIGTTLSNSFVAGSLKNRTTIYDAIISSGSRALSEKGHSGFTVLSSSMVELDKSQKTTTCESTSTKERH